MSRKRKPVIMPIADATEALYWRAKILHESFEHPHANMALCRRQLGEALEDYRTSKAAIFTGILATQQIYIYTCKACEYSCTETRDGLCNRCFSKTAPVDGAQDRLSFAPRFGEDETGRRVLLGVGPKS